MSLKYQDMVVIRSAFHQSHLVRRLVILLSSFLNPLKACSDEHILPERAIAFLKLTPPNSKPRSHRCHALEIRRTNTQKILVEEDHLENVWVPVGHSDCTLETVRRRQPAHNSLAIYIETIIL